MNMADTERSEVFLACMPFGPVFRPSLGLSLLKASLERHGIQTRVRYFSIGFAERIGQHFYSGIAVEGRPPQSHMAGEWMFAGALDPAHPSGEPYIDRVLRGRVDTDCIFNAAAASDSMIRRLVTARGRVDAFLSDCLDEVVEARPRIVGFTSTFQQHVASLALARRIKARLPGTFIVFGGANCEGVMGAETLRQFPFVDAVVSGEGDVVFPELARRVLSGAALDDLVGVRTAGSIPREFAADVFPNAPVLQTLDDLPYPDFSDYMAQFASSRYGKKWQPVLLFETSRGCWWGAKHHCTFCGLNGATMAFRSKSPGRALDELFAIADRYPECRVEVVDNILDMQYFKTFLPALARRRPPIELFYETKANLKKDQVRLLAAAGVNRIQPGIESLSDPVLKLMDKGVSGLQNIQLLKWCKELGVQPMWNVIWGFPGEPEVEYARMASLVSRLTHLPAPRGFGSIRLDRFSPNFTNAERLGFANVRPFEPYRHVFAAPDAVLANLAYFFEFDYPDGRDPETYARPLARALGRWQRQHRDSDLCYLDVDGLLIVWDFRPGARRALIILRGLDRELHGACDEITDFSSLAALASDQHAAGEADVRQRLDRLVADGLVLEDHGRYLALAVKVGPYQPPRHVAARMFREIRACSRASNPTEIRVDGPVPRTKLDRASFSVSADGTVIVRSLGSGPAWGRPRSH